MGHIINPIVMRLNLNRFWNSVWVSYTKLNYTYILFNDLYLYKYIARFFDKQIFIDRETLYGYTKILRKFKKVNIYIYIYDPIYISLILLIFENYKSYYKYLVMQCIQNPLNVSISIKLINFFKLFYYIKSFVYIYNYIYYKRYKIRLLQKYNLRKHLYKTYNTIQFKTLLRTSKKLYLKTRHKKLKNIFNFKNIKQQPIEIIRVMALNHFIYGNMPYMLLSIYNDYYTYMYKVKKNKIYLYLYILYIQFLIIFLQHTLLWKI